MRFNKSLKVYKRKEFYGLLNSLGFYEISKNKHPVFANKKGQYITVPSKGKEVNAMMTTVILQRIKHNNLEILDKQTYNRCVANNPIFNYE